MKIEISNVIYLELYSLAKANAFYHSIHKVNDETDQYRTRLKNKHRSIEDTKEIIRDAIDDKYKLDGTPDFFIYFENEIAGVFEFAPLEEGTDFVEVGYWLFKEYRRRGILTSVFPSMIEFAKNNFDRARLIATTPLDNLASRKLLEKCHFTNTGKIQEFTKEDGIIEKDIEYEYPLDV